jgi:hypothetical protein
VARIRVFAHDIQWPVAHPVGESTVKSHVKHVLGKMHAANRPQATARYLRMVHRREAA